MRGLLLGALLTIAANGSGMAVSTAGAAPRPANQSGNAPASSKAAHTRNPVAATAASVEAGRAVYLKQCAACHGDTGRGDGSMGEELSPKPADLTDAEWKHGSTDGEIFTLIRSGVKGTGMKAYGRKLKAHQVWDVVNYIRSIGPAKSH